MRITESPSQSTLHLEGAVGFPVAGELHSLALTLTDGQKSVVVDCSAVDRLDSSALQIFLAISSALASKHLSFRISGANQSVLKYLELAGGQFLCQ